MHITPGSNRLCGKAPGCVHAHKNTRAHARALDIPLAVRCPSVNSLFTAQPFITRSFTEGRMPSLKEPPFEYKVCLARLQVLTLTLSPLASADDRIIRRCTCARALCLFAYACCHVRLCVCVRLRAHACGRAPPDHSCYIINSDQICFVA